MGWRYWITRVGGGVKCGGYGARNVFCRFVLHFIHPYRTWQHQFAHLAVSPIPFSGIPLSRSAGMLFVGNEQ